MSATAEFQVTGMTCSHCEQAVSHEVRQIPGVEQVEVSAATGRLVIHGATSISDAQVMAAVDEAGYQASRLPDSPSPSSSIATSS